MLKLAPNLSLPLEIAGQTLVILGIRGSGKTNTAGALAEELLDQHQPIAIIDPTDAWWGLRAGRDGSSEGGYQVFIFGGHHGDVPLEETDGKVIAEFLVREKVPVILSMRHLRKAAQRRFVTEFCEELYHLKGNPDNRTPLTVFIDEAPLFAPQKVIGEVARTVGAIEDLISRGRVSGFGVVLISQRSATLNADVRTQADTMLCHRVTASLDRKAISDWFEENASVDDLKKILSSLATMKNGQAWVWSPSLGIMTQVQMRLRRTFDSSATPTAGKQSTRGPKTLADVDIEKLKAQMAAAIEHKKANDPAELKRRIADLEKENGKRIQATPAPDPAVIAEAERCARAEGRENVLQLLDGPMQYMREAVRLLESALGFITSLPAPGESGPRAMPVTVTARAIDIPASLERSTEDAPPRRVIQRSPGEKIPEGERTILVAVAQYPKGAGRQQISILTGYKRSSRDAYLQRLKSKGFIEANGDQITATKAGIQALGSFEPLPTGAALRKHWVAKLPEGESKILALLIHAYPNAVTRDSISGITDYKRSSRDAYLQRLRTRKLIAVSGGGVVASSDLFATK